MSNIYLALGDSITAGYGVGRTNSFASICYATLVSSCPGLSHNNLGVNGLTSGTFAEMLSAKHVRALLSRASIVSLTIGSNDLLTLGKASLTNKPANLTAACANLAKNLQIAGTAIRTVNPNALVKVATIYCPLTSGAYQSYSGLAQNAVGNANQIIAQWAGVYNFVVAPVDQAFMGRESLLLGPDFLHPNLAGHRVIAEQFLPF